MKYSTKMNSSEDEERLYVNNKITYEQSNVQRSYKSSAILESTYKSYNIPEHYASFHYIGSKLVFAQLLIIISLIGFVLIFMMNLPCLNKTCTKVAAKQPSFQAVRGRDATISAVMLDMIIYG